MANNLQGVNLARIAQKSLDSLVTQLVPLADMFVTDFSSEVAKGPSITTRYPLNPTVKTLRSSAQRAPDDQATTPVTVTIGDPRGVDIGFDDVEMINSEINLFKLFIRPAVVAIIEDIVTGIFQLCTAANYPQVVTLLPDDYDADQVSLIAQAMSAAKIPTSPRNALVAPTYYGPLGRDNSVQLAYALGSDAVIRTGKIPTIHGIGQWEYNGNIPDNGERLRGIVSGAQGVCLAARAPITPDQWYGQVENTVESVTGLPVQFRYFYDGAKHRLQMLTQSGSAVGNPGFLFRIQEPA
jgi:hypothetical protein